MGTDDILIRALALSQRAVSRVFGMECEVDERAVFADAGKQVRAVVAVRQLSLWAMRDVFGLTLGEIAHRTGIARRNVMRSVARIRFLSRVEDDYERASRMIRREAEGDGE